MKIALIATSLLAGCSQVQGGCIGDLRQAAENQSKSWPMRVKVAASVGDGTASQQMNSTIEFVSPDTFHFIFEEAGEEQYRIGNSSWYKEDSYGKLQKQARISNLKYDIHLQQRLPEDDKRIKNLKCDGKKSIDGKTYRTIEFSVGLPEATVRETGVDITQDYVVYIDDNIRPVIFSEKGQLGNLVSVTTNKFTYDSTIKIEAPK